MPAARNMTLVALAHALHLVRGEVLKLESRPIPAPYSVEAWAVFTVYSLSDAPSGDWQVDHPFVEYRTLQAEAVTPGMTERELDGYRSLQFTLVSKDDYHTQIERHPTCNNERQLEAKGDDVTQHTTSFTRMTTELLEIKRTGTYFLLVSNCGAISAGTLTGAVAVRNVYGYASGTDYHKMVAYGWVFSAYALAALAWTVVCAMRKSDLATVHGIVGAAIAFGLVESGAWYLHLSGVNQTGVVGETEVRVLVMLTVLATYTTYTLVLAEASDDGAIAKFGFFGIVWIVASYLRVGAMANRQSNHISSTIMTGTAMSSMIVNVLAFAWLFLRLFWLSKTLKERGLDDDLKRVSFFSIGLGIVVVFSAVVFPIQLLDAIGSLQIDWEFQFLIDSGLSHISFLAMIGLAMFLWLPQEGNVHMYQPPVEEEEDRLMKENSDEDTAWAQGGNKVAPDTLGAAAN